MSRELVDVLVVGSGMGGASFAAGLAPSGAKILILERGERLTDSAAIRDPRAIFQRGHFRPDETWLDGAGQPFNPGNYYYVGGNSKLYGAVLIRYRAQDFAPIVHLGGTTAGWPFAYEELEPWYARAEALYEVRGALGDDATEPFHSRPFPHPPVADEPAIAAARERMKRVGLVTIGAKLVVLAAGAVNTAALLLRSGEGGLANRSGAVGRHFMNHNASAVLAVDPRVVNDSVYQKTLGINDFYLSDGRGGPPLGNIQLLGRITAPILKPSLPWAPEAALGLLTRRTVDWYAMSEDLPNPESRVTVDGAQIRLDWKRSNWDTHLKLVGALKERLRAAGYPIVLTKPFDRRTPSHQCGTVRLGNDPAHAPVDAYGRAFDHPNLFVVDASLLPTSAAVNPSLTVAALALRAADHIASNDLRT
jgi:choline dehydrogenase-like flavoprotein